ncbi:effector-associated constant component EACC1 [Acrocarpospora catenulata]|uniref:effector-associated constant component EACC1 n=1 Tax=Acrocarpospora catenulata TaxID=2836182 RepID=UPI0027DF760E|nr:hypothetical protein [Acrocarpospora catenulata]
MEARIGVSGDDEVAELADLQEWLRGERALIGRVRSVSRPPAENELGGALDVLVVALGTGGAGVALARSLTAWLQTRRVNVAITVTSPSGSVKVDAQRIKDEAVLPMLQEVLRAGDEL